MMDFFFFIKMFILTIAIVLVMQIQFDNQSLETHAMSWVQSAAVIGPLHGIKRGAAQLVHDLSHKISSVIHDNVSKNKREDSHLKKESPMSWTKSAKSSSSETDED